jgi:hypothetical protein
MRPLYLKGDAMEETVDVRTQIKTFVKKHKVAIAIVGTSLVWFQINRTALAQHDEFLKEHGLFDLFYNFADEF